MAVDLSLAEWHWKHDLLGSIEVGIVVLNAKYEVQVWNQFMENHSNVVPGFIKDKCLFDFFPEVDEAWFKRKAEPAFSLRCPVFIIWEQRPYLFKFGTNRAITSSNDFMYQNVTIFPLASLTGSVEQICIVVYDVTDQAMNSQGIKTLNKQLERISRVDGLTGLYNRRYWEEQFELEFMREKRTDAPSSVVMLDIDHFKKINDTYGHPAGDDVIRSLAQIIQKATRATDISGRYGGEEFAILLPDTPVANVEFLTERIRRLVEKFTVIHEEHEIQFTVSIGIAGFNQSYQQYIHWLEAADKALYKAKESGRNKVILAP
jgi:diguanylate cyclase